MSDLDDEELEATRRLNGVAKKNDIEKDIKRCEQLIKPEHANWIGISNQLAMAHLIEKIKELEQENRIQRRQLNRAFDRGWIPKEKVKEIVKEAIEIIESEQFKVIMGDMTKVGRLRYLLEEELLDIDDFTYEEE